MQPHGKGRKVFATNLYFINVKDIQDKSISIDLYSRAKKGIVRLLNLVNNPPYTHLEDAKTAASMIRMRPLSALSEGMGTQLIYSKKKSEETIMNQFEIK